MAFFIGLATIVLAIILIAIIGLPMYWYTGKKITVEKSEFGVYVVSGIITIIILFIISFLGYALWTFGNWILGVIK